MTLTEIKQEISSATGVPISLLTGETAEEDIARAKALIAYKRKSAEQRPKTTRELFAEWANETNEPPAQDQDEINARLSSIEARARTEAGFYPVIKDGGEVLTPGDDPRSKEAKFKEWVNEKTAFDPRRNPWTSII